jgi:hypothetical protein
MIINNEQIKRVVAKGKPLSVIKGLITKELLRLDRVKFDEAMRAEYDSLYPMYREATKEEYELEFAKKEDMYYDEFYPYFENGDRQFPEFKIEIDYSQDENYVTFEEYKNETIVVQEAVYYTYQEYLLNATDPLSVIDENTFNEAPLIKTEEAIEQVRPYTPIEVTEELIQSELDKMSEYKEYRKVLKNKELDEIQVTISNGKTFDADRNSRNNMLSALQASEILGQSQTEWKLSDNTWSVCTVPEIKQAIALGVQKEGEILKKYG